MNAKTTRLLADALAGLTVALVALPLAIAFGQASGMGAQAGITTAVIAGFLAAAFGGSRFQVSGPTGAMTVVLIPIISSDGPTAVLFIGLLAGVILTAVGLLKLGRHIHRLPTSIIEGFTAGIAVIIALQQMGPALGQSVTAQPKVYATAWLSIAGWVSRPDIASLLVTAICAVAVYLGTHRWPRVPVSIAVLVLASLVASWGHLGLATVQSLPGGIGIWNLSFLEKSTATWNLIMPALAVAALAALESLLSAKVADSMRNDGTVHNSDKELLGQGIANLVTPFFGGIPATAALARTAVNVRSGAQTRLAAMFHAVFLAGIVLLLSNLVTFLPMPALAGVLLATAAHMIRPIEILHTIKASRLDGLILIATFILTIVTDLTTALIIGVLAWLILRKTPLSHSLPPISQDETLGD